MKSWEDLLSAIEPDRSKTEFVFLSRKDEAANAQSVAAFFVSEPAHEALTVDEREEELFRELLSGECSQTSTDKVTFVCISGLYAMDGEVESDVKEPHSVRALRSPRDTQNLSTFARFICHVFSLTAMSPMDRPNRELVPVGVIDKPGQFGLVFSAPSKKFWMFLRAMRYASGLPRVWRSRGFIPDRSCPMLSTRSRRPAMT